MTATEWFFKWFNDNPEAMHKEFAEAFEQAKQMEKDLISEAWNDGNFLGRNGNILADYDRGEQYYNKKYGGKK